jgi:hypothetical protein
LDVAEEVREGLVVPLPLDAEMVDLEGGGFCFHFLRVATALKAKSVLERSRAWAQLPSGPQRTLRGRRRRCLSRRLGP